VTVEDTTAAISFVESLKQGGRRKLDLGDTENTFVKGKKTAIVVIISPSDATTAASAWDYITSDHGSPNAYVDAVVRRLAPHVSCAPPTRPSPYMSAGALVTPSPPPTDGGGQLDAVRMVVGRVGVRVDDGWAVQGRGPYKI